MMLLSLTLLVGLVYYVYNVGEIVNRRVDAQSAADAVAVSGGGWMARSMNVIAQDNVAMSRYLAAAVVLDSLPLSSRMALEESSAWAQALANQLGRGIPNTAGGNYVRDGLQSLQTRMATQRDILIPVDQSINRSGFDMSLTTHWYVRGNGPTPNGSLWQVIQAMDQLSQATKESAGVLAQNNAVRWSKENNSAAAFVVPVVPVLPARRTTLDDFQPTLMGREMVTSEGASLNLTGGAGGAIPDMEYPHRLGPWARLYHWRHNLTRSTGRVWVPPTAGWGAVRGSTGNVQTGGRRVGSSARTPVNPGHGGYWQSTGSEVIGYSTYGPFRWMMDVIDWWTNDHWSWNQSGRWLHEGRLSDTYFYKYIGDLSRIKLNYMFPYAAPKQPVLYHAPNWITDYQQAVQTARIPNVRITSTMFYLVEIASRVPEDAPGYLSPGSFRTNGKYPIANWTPGWVDPARWGIPKVCDYIWKDNYSYQTTQDLELGITMQRDATGQPIWQPVYMTSWWVFGGIDVGGDAQVSNPCNWQQGEEIPAPMLLDTSVGDYDPVTLDPDGGARRDYFTYLGVVAKDPNPSLWPGRFNTGQPAMYSLAQAKVFNNKSWDLWTQDWQVQLAPVSQWDDWQRRLAAGLADVPATRGAVDPQAVEGLQRYMAKFSKSTAEAYLKH